MTAPGIWSLPDVGVLPVGWRELAPLDMQGTACRRFEHTHGVRVLVTREDRGPDCGVWFHVSLSRANKLPSWRDVREVKDLFIGKDRCAIHMLPPEAFYINLHPHTLHLFTRLDGPTVPPQLYEDQ